MVDCGELEDMTLRMVKGLKVGFNPYQEKLYRIRNAKKEASASLVYARKNSNFLNDDDMSYIRELSDLNTYLLSEFRSLLSKDYDVKNQFFRNLDFFRQ